MPNTALDGIKVLDLTHHIAGPYCTKLLADFGAEVIKVERPGSGDPSRRIGPFVQDEPHLEKSLLFLYLNTNKRSVSLNLKSTTGRHILKRLVQEADVVVENFSPRVLPSLGLGFDDLKMVNPRIVLVSISNFGQTGPYRDYQATDIVEYALGGLMYILGSHDREPLKHALHQAQFKAGVNGASAATIALYHQQLRSEGQWVDVSIQECIASGMRDTTSLYTYMGAVRQREPGFTGDIHRSPVEVKDGYVVPVSFGTIDWEQVADLLDAPELTEARFSTPEARSQNAQELEETLHRSFAKWEMQELFHEAHRRRGLIYGLVQSPQQMVESPQFQERGYFVDIDHPVAGKATYPGAPFVMTDTPWQARSSAPTLGQHNQEVLCDRLGYSLQELVQLRGAGVI